MSKRLNVTLLIDGKPIVNTDTVQVDVFMCDQCHGKGQFVVTSGTRLYANGKVERHQDMHHCKKCRGSGFVIYLSRPEKAEVPS